MTATDDFSGDLPSFADRYVAEKAIGKGAISTVYVGTDRLLGRRVAIKVLKPRSPADEALLQQYFRDASTTCDLHHPNIVTTYDIGQQNGAYYIVREFVDGQSLADIIKADGHLPEDVAIGYAKQIAGALEYAHAKGVVHSDIQPEHIFVTADGIVKIADFNLVPWEAQNSLAFASGQELGSIYYMSPEQLENKPLGPASDLYSLGVVMYEMLAGEVPYSGDTPVSIAVKHITAPIPVLNLTQLGVSAAVVVIVGSLLQKNPRDRFSSDEELVAALDAIQIAPQVPPREADPPQTAPDTAMVMMDAIANRFARKSDPPEWASAKPSRRWPSANTQKVIGIVVGLVLILGGLAYAAFTQYVVLPDYTGMNVALAKSTLAHEGLAVTIRPQSSIMVLPHHVIEQSPVAGRWLRKGSDVLLSVSTGNPVVSVPNVVGLRINDAQRMLHGSSLAATPKYRFDQSPAGNVLQEKPSAGSRVTESTTIALAVSSGPTATPSPAPTTSPTTSPSPAPSPTAAAVARNPQPSVRSEGGLRIYPSSACTAGNLGVELPGFDKGCTAMSIASSGRLLHSVGTGYIVPVTSPGHPGNVEYGLMYYKPAYSVFKRFLGVLPGDGSGHLIVRVQNGMFVEQNGSRAKYSTFDGLRMILLETNY